MSGISLACTVCVSAIAGLIAWGVVPGHRWFATALAVSLCVAAALLVRRFVDREFDTEPEIRPPAFRERTPEERSL